MASTSALIGQLSNLLRPKDPKNPSFPSIPFCHRLNVKANVCAIARTRKPFHVYSLFGGKKEKSENSDDTQSKAMVDRGDLGAELPIEEVPLLQLMSCFKHEEESCASNFEENIPTKESGKTELNEARSEKKHWSLEIRKVVDRIFRLHGERWTVPWTAETIVQVMLLWIASFWFVGSWIIPFLSHAAGFSKQSLSHRGQALYSLLTDIAEGLAGIAILHRCLARFLPLPSGWFRFSLKGNWQFDVGIGCLLFPLVNFLSQININLVPSVGVSSVEQSIVARDPVAMALYAVVVSVCAPVWEEIVFRGFLLPSLTRYMPLSWSIVVSAVAFALAHFNAQRFLPLMLLGVVMGAVFARSRNLLASMLLHSLWNGFVFWELMR